MEPILPEPGEWTMAIPAGRGACYDTIQTPDFWFAQATAKYRRQRRVPVRFIRQMWLPEAI